MESANLVYWAWQCVSIGEIHRVFSHKMDPEQIVKRNLMFIFLPSMSSLSWLLLGRKRGQGLTFILTLLKYLLHIFYREKGPLNGIGWKENNSSVCQYLVVTVQCYTHVPPVFQNVRKVITSRYYQHPDNHGINGILLILQHPQTAIENPVI